MEVSRFKEGGDEGVVGEAVPRGHFVEEEVRVAGVEWGAARVHEEDGVGGREGGGDVAGLEEELVELPAGGGAARAEELDAGVDVQGDGHDSSSMRLSAVKSDGCQVACAGSTGPNRILVQPSIKGV